MPFLLTVLAQAALFAALLRGPLFWAFHFEYALAANLSLAALAGPWTIASFWPRRGVFDASAGPRRSLPRCLVLLAIPLALGLGAQALVGSCDPLEGLGWYALLPGAGMPLAWALAAGCAVLAPSRRRAFALYAFAVIVAALALGARFYFGLSFKSYHLLLGFWPGVLYDEYVPIEPPLLLARLEALLLAGGVGALALASIGALRRGRLLAAFLLAGFVLCWMAEGPAGIHPSRERIERELGLVFQGRHATWVADGRAAATRSQLPLLAARLDHQAERVAGKLAIDNPPPMRVYLFASAEEKRRAIGAEHTVVTRPWLGELYLHAGSRAHEVLRHEMVHLAAARWALPGVGISPNVALLEGLAVSLGGEMESAAQPEGLARAALEERPGFDLGGLLTGGGFWRFHPGIAYPLAGAFVDFLRQTISRQEMARLYRWGGIAQGRRISELIARWRAALEERPGTTALERALAKTLLEARPIHEKRCAHEVAECLSGGFVNLDDLARARALDPARGDVAILEARLALAAGDAGPLEALLPENPESDDVPAPAQVGAAEGYASSLAQEGNWESAARWAAFVSRWSADLGARWSAARTQALARAGGSEPAILWKSADGRWGLHCEFHAGCTEAKAEAGEAFPGPLAEFAAALEQYGRSLGRRDFEGAARWAGRMSRAEGAPGFLTDQARRTGEEAQWLAANYEWYEKGVRRARGE